MPIHSGPHYTQFPDELLDFWMAGLTGAEWKVLCYIVRHTFGWKKDADAISYQQFLHGVYRRDGTCADRGTGITSRATLSRVLDRLEEKQLIRRVPSRTSGGQQAISAYEVWVCDEETVAPAASEAAPRPQLTVVAGGQSSITVLGRGGGQSSIIEPAQVQKVNSATRKTRVQKVNPQETTTLQETTKQETAAGADKPRRARAAKATIDLLATDHDREATAGRKLGLKMARDVLGVKTVSVKALARYEAFCDGLLDRGWPEDDLRAWMDWMDSGTRYWRGKGYMFQEERMLAELCAWDGQDRPEVKAEPVGRSEAGRRLDPAEQASRQAQAGFEARYGH